MIPALAMPLIVLTGALDYAPGVDDVPDLPPARLACAIRRLHPSRKPADVAMYAETHLRLARRHGLDPLLLAALAAHESDHRWQIVGPDCELGIYQWRPTVDPPCSLDWPERDRLRAHRARLAAERGAAELARWRDYHEQECGRRRPHSWVIHFNQGGNVIRAGHHAGYGSRVWAEYRRLVSELRGCTGSDNGLVL